MVIPQPTQRAGARGDATGTVGAAKFRDITITAVRKEVNGPNPASDSRRTRWLGRIRRYWKSGEDI